MCEHKYGDRAGYSSCDQRNDGHQQVLVGPRLLHRRANPDQAVTEFSEAYIASA